MTRKISFPGTYPDTSVTFPIGHPQGMTLFQLARWTGKRIPRNTGTWLDRGK